MSNPKKMLKTKRERYGKSLCSNPKQTSKRKSKSIKKMWSNRSEKEIEKIVRKGLHTRISKMKKTQLEKLLEQIVIIQNLPYKYVGDGSFILGRKVPDFIHVKKKKICIEVFHPRWKIKDYGSIEKFIKIRSEEFSKYGWKTIFVQEKEIYDDLQKVLDRIKETEEN